MERQSTSGVRIHLRLNGAALVVCAVAGYALHGGSWWVFAGFLFVPDLWMLGYLASPAIGATFYNAGHSLLIPAALVGLGLFTDAGDLLVSLGLIYATHIGLDRMAGYGYKYPTGFKDTDIARA